MSEEKIIAELDAYNLAAARRKLAQVCINCRSAKNPQCDGRAGRTCSDCAENGLECSFPPHMVPLPELIHGTSKLTLDQIKPWDRPIEAMEDVGTELPTPDEKHFFVFPCIRCSSDPGALIMQLLANQHPTMIQRYNALLNGGLQNVPESARPGGQGTFMQWQGVVFARQGTRAVPTQHTNGLVDPSLVAFVNRLHAITGANNQNRPIAIRFLTLGIAGFSVGIGGFGDRFQGFFRFMLDRDQQNGTALARHIDIVSVVEPLVVTGLPDSLHPGQNSPDWQGYFGKYVLMNRLEDLVDRYTTNNNHNQLVATGQLPLMAVPAPTPQEARLDRHIKALGDEWSWRANQLSPVTAPTDLNVSNRNFQRNRTWA